MNRRFMHETVVPKTLLDPRPLEKSDGQLTA